MGPECSHIFIYLYKSKTERDEPHTGTLGDLKTEETEKLKDVEHYGTD